MYQKTVLPNGVRVVTSRMDHVRSATLILYFRVGSRYESDDQAGISHFLEHMVFKGTERRPDPIMLTQEIEGVGGILNAATSRESTNYWVKVPSAHLARAFDVLADMLRHSTFDPEELEKERFVIIEEIRGIHDTPDDLIHDVIDELVWDGQSVGRPVIGSVDTVSAISREDLITYLRTQYRPDRLVIAAAGDIHHEQVVELAEQYFGDLPASDVNTFVQAEVRQQEPRVRLLTRPTEQAHLCVAVPALPYTDDRRYVQEMIDAVLSSGMSSRLFQEIRERLGLVYEVYGYFREYADVGQGVVYAGTDPARVEQTIEAILREFDKLRREPVPADELERTKELRRGRIVMGLEDSRAVAAWVGSQEAVFGEILTPEEVMARIDAVTAEQIQELATELFRPDLLNLAIVGPYEAESHFRSLLHL
ncbi:M16 family metallopeptidase [Sphaerobacter thermophilus]|uniref:Peptidase M16 domain protein n=1 Tax=Sphaerobacter thermophilus (strain ATCC 49802 / DSM 20745 / KCCM 41009 / NCIMB 13125 / S 6022) TaxID=479434 RepID=D1C5Q6_SPHTD|nr:pitrilysin family protein [Sphaerobacter thermophilus]ACZ39458.1 peptidase M16 domain protein [Sphaerobacter thermophilus DSM 20745]PZN67877.1 MAG: insulinase family protein [Sphaerobacter thermophilus]